MHTQFIVTNYVGSGSTHISYKIDQIAPCGLGVSDHQKERQYLRLGPPTVKPCCRMP